MCFNHAWLLLISFVLGHMNAAVSAFYLFSYGISLTRLSWYTTVEHLIFLMLYTHACMHTHAHTEQCTRGGHRQRSLATSLKMCQYPSDLQVLDLLCKLRGT